METSTIVKIKSLAMHMRETKDESVRIHSCNQILTECDNLDAEIDNLRSGLEDVMRTTDMINSTNQKEISMEN